MKKDDAKEEAGVTIPRQKRSQYRTSVYWALEPEITTPSKHHITERRDGNTQIRERPTWQSTTRDNAHKKKKQQLMNNRDQVKEEVNARTRSNDTSEKAKKGERERVEQVDESSNWDTTHGNQEGSMQRTLLPEERQQSEARRLNHFMSKKSNFLWYYIE